ncbi:hypothetical protein BC828DRAFT_383586 [Blastocladiella britannica]|nr:hypothetical protein BC828DRAFT_383586 [Blastocladiella britannica]
MLGMTGVRLYRLTLSVDKSHVRRTMAVLAVTTIALLTSFGVTVWLRIREYAHMNPRTLAVTTDAELVNIRAIESLVTFVVFLILNLVSLGGDIAFNLVVIHSAKQLGNETTRLQQIKDGLVYVPSMCVNIAYFTIVCWARLIPSSDPNSRMLQYFGIMLSRFAPSLEMIVFLGFTIEQTNKILRQRRPSSRQSSKQSHGKSLSGRAWSTASWKKESGAPGGSAAADTAHSIMATRSADAGGTSRYGQSEANIYPRQQTEASIGVAGPK